MQKEKKSKKMLFIGILVALITVFSISSAQAEWYMSNIIQIVPRAASGNTFVQLQSVDGSYAGVARGFIDANDPGAKEMLAVLLTAFSLDYNINVEMATTPSWEPSQRITSVAVAKP
jgi:hypothetical protein